MLVLAGDQLLLWNVQGRAQLRIATGTWTDEFQLLLRAVRAVERDGAGFLPLGSSAPGVAAILLFNPDGKEVVRWTRPNEPIFALAVDARGRRAAGRTGFLPLLTDGTWGAPQAYPGDAADHQRGRFPRIIEHEGRPVVCYGADLTKQHWAPGRCQQIGEGGWRFEGTFVEPPLACGAWLVARDGAKLQALTVRSLATGQAVGQQSYQARPAIACGATDELVAGERRLHSAQLPSLARRWSRSVGASSVHAVAVRRDLIAYKVENSSDVVLTPRAM